MYLCRLFQRDRPFEQVEARLIADGRLTIGRDPEAGWSLPDLDGTLSRIHCTLAVMDGRLLLSDSSTNGTFLDDGSRLPAQSEVPIDVRRSFHVGAMTILVDHLPDDGRDDDVDGTARILPGTRDCAPMPGDWIDAAAPRAPHRDASLIEAFCEGARIDASMLSSEDPADLMRRAGAIYQQTILGLATLMAERTRLKAHYALDRTTVGAADNNPFKWAPTRRLAQDLLCAGDSGFLSDAAAVRASFEDLGCHMAGLADGAQAGVDAVLATLSPDAVDAEARARRQALRTHAAVARDVHAERHARLADGGDDAAARAFAAAYLAGGKRPA